jgi:sugar phosphate isomerase/epimerase
MQELAVVVSNGNKNCTVYETIDAIKEAGFKNVFIQWYNYKWNITQEEQLEYIKKQGLNVIFAHLSYWDINDIWIEGSKGDLLVDYYKNDIRKCFENNIPMVIMHLTDTFDAPPYCEVGVKRLKEIADYAQELGIKIAFENTKIKGYLEYVFDHIDNDNVGLCFDSGHSHTHFNDEFDFAKYKDKIFAVHLHDNFKNGDLHLLPFDGDIDWELLIDNLISCNYIGPITMELCYRGDYLKMNIKDFYKKGYEIGIRIKELFNNKLKNNEFKIIKDNK